MMGEGEGENCSKYKMMKNGAMLYVEDENEVTRLREGLQLLKVA